MTARSHAAESSDWTDAILKTSESLIAVFDTAGRFLRLNRTGEILTGYSENEVLGQCFWEIFVFADEIPVVRKEFENVTATPTGASRVFRSKSRWKMRNGSARTFSWSTAAIRNAVGKVDCILYTGIDLTGLFEIENSVSSLSKDFIEAQGAASANVSRYLHDTVSQNLVVLGFSLSELQRRPEPECSAELQNAVGLVDRCCRDLRALTYALAPPLFEATEAASALQWYGAALREDAGIEVEIRADAVPADTAAEVRSLLLGAIREWAEKAIRRSRGATRISLLAKSSQITLEFQCNRADDEAVGGILSSRVIRERIRALGGRAHTRQEKDGISVRISVDSKGEPKMNPVRILVADDHQLVREGLVNILSQAHPEWEIVAQAADGQQAIELGESLRPDIAILDLSMPESNGLEVTERLASSVSGIRILVLTVHIAEPVMRQLRRAGASAFISKNEAPLKLVDAVERMLAGESFFASESASRSPSELPEHERVPVQYLLTPRELEVLKLLAQGMSNKQIASTLNMSVRTVESHRASILARLEVESVGDLIRLAILDGVV